MKALTIRQPFAWLIVNGHKTIENRTWSTLHRGPLLIHAGATLHAMPIPDIERRYGVKIDRDALKFGGIVGRVNLVDIVMRSSSRWFDGPFGWVLADPCVTKFARERGFQTLFDSSTYKETK